MNEQLQQALADIIQRAVSGVDTATAFLSEQLPDVVHQLLLWYGISSFIAWFISVSIIVLSIMYTVKVCSHKPKRKDGETGMWNAYEESFFNDEDGDIRDRAVVALVAAGVSSFVSLMVAVHNIDWLMILIAPKVWLLEYAGKLVS